MTGPPRNAAPPAGQGQGREDASAGVSASQGKDTATAAAAQCSMPESTDGNCAYPITCTCRGMRFFEELLAIARRFEKGRLVVAKALSTDPATVDSLIEHRLEIEAARTPDNRAKEAA